MTDVGTLPDNYAFAKARGGKIYFRGFTETHEIQEKYNYCPTYFIKSQKETSAVSVYGDELKRVEFNSIAEGRNWKNEMKEIGIPVFGDISEEIQFISDLPKNKHIAKDDLRILYYDIETTVDGGFPDVREASETITAISTYDTSTNSVHIFSYQYFDLEAGLNELLGELTQEEIDYILKYKIVEHQFNNERDMLVDFVRYWRDVNPHIISGWNIDGFDNPYIYNRYKRVFGETVAKSLSPFDIVNWREYKDGFGRDQVSCELFGIASLDYLEVYKNNTFHSMPNYKLDTVAEYETGSRKIQHDGTFKDFYTNHWNKFIVYNIRDSILVHEIDKESDLMSVSINVSYTCGVNFADSFGSVKKIDAKIYNFVKEEKNQVIPPAVRGEPGQFVGAFIKEPETRLMRAVASFDLESLYPSLLRELNISPETLIKQIPPELESVVQSVDIDNMSNMKPDLSKLKDYGYTIAPNGALYDVKEMGIIPEVTESIFLGRKTAKKESGEYWKKAQGVKDDKELYHEYMTVSNIKGNEQLALKVLINSIYGCLGNNNFRYYELKNAEAVTSAGQSAIKYIGNRIDSWLKDKICNNFNYLAYIDTDSTYFCLEPLMERVKDADYETKFGLLQKFADGPMQDKINEYYKEYAAYRNCPKNLMNMDREAIAVQGGFWVKKKKYALLVDDMEGKRYETAQWKIMGMEAIKSGSYPAHVRKVLKDIIELVVLHSESDVQNYIKKLKVDFFENWGPDDFCTITTANEIDKWVDSNGNFIKGTPIQSRAAHNFNKYVKEHNLGLPLFDEGDKIKFIYLKEPNKIGRVIAYNDVSDLSDIVSLVDYYTHWHKNVLKPIKIMLDAVGFEPEHKNKLF